MVEEKYLVISQVRTPQVSQMNLDQEKVIKSSHFFYRICVDIAKKST